MGKRKNQAAEAILREVLYEDEAGDGFLGFYKDYKTVDLSRVAREGDKEDLAEHVDIFLEEQARDYRLGSQHTKRMVKLLSRFRSDAACRDAVLTEVDNKAKVYAEIILEERQEHGEDEMERFFASEESKRAWREIKDNNTMRPGL